MLIPNKPESIGKRGWGKFGIERTIIPNAPDMKKIDMLRKISFRFFSFSIINETTKINMCPI